MELPTGAAIATVLGAASRTVPADNSAKARARRMVVIA
jgi:hypothetical protein